MKSIQPQAGQGFQFPGEFEISAMGAREADLPTLVPSLLLEAGLLLVSSEVRTRPSRQGNYLSVTVSFSATCREDYDAAHAALRACPLIKWTL